MERFIWQLKGTPVSVEIVDKDGHSRRPNLDKVKEHSRLKPAFIAGSRYGRGVGAMFYGGKLGNKKELARAGNKYTTNDEILEAIGYQKAPQKD
jgi:hypothetical protein